MDTVESSISSEPEARAAEIWTSTVSALKDVVREHGITQDELHIAADWLTRLGEAGVIRSLIDVALSMTSLDVAEAGRAGTRANPEGPYYRADAPVREDGRLMTQPVGADAKMLTVTGRVLDETTGAPIEGAEVDVWQADSNGLYDHEGFHLRGRVRTQADGRYRFTTVVPAEYTEHDDDPIGELFRLLGRHNYRAGHIHVKVHALGAVRLTTQLFMADAAHLDSDYVEGAVSPDLTVDRVPSADGEALAEFDFRVSTTDAR